jgi:hypothetical protein
MNGIFSSMLPISYFGMVLRPRGDFTFTLFRVTVSDVPHPRAFRCGVRNCVEERLGFLSKSFRNGRLEWGLQMIQLSATRCSCIAILWVSLVSFAAITLCVASQWLFVVVVVVVVVVYFFIDSVRKLLYTPSYSVPVFSILTTNEDMCYVLYMTGRPAFGPSYKY